MRTQGCLFAILLLALSANAKALTIDGHDYSAEVAASFADTSYLMRAGVGFFSNKRLLQGESWRINAIVELYGGYWRAKSTDANPEELFEFGVSGIAQLSWESVPEFFIEISTGPSYLSKTAINGQRFGSHLQFASHFGLGWRIDDAWSVAYRLEHLSNSGLATPNPGVDYHQVNIRYRPRG